MIEMRIPGIYGVTQGTSRRCQLQLCARLNRPIIVCAAITASTEESHICGQILVRGGATSRVFLASAMHQRWVYLPMNMISHSRKSWRLPASVGRVSHRSSKSDRVALRRTRINDFAVIGTGNTNGSGDETGLYRGTNIQERNNFSRFCIVSHVSTWTGLMSPRCWKMGLLKSVRDHAYRFRNPNP